MKKIDQIGWCASATLVLIVVVAAILPVQAGPDGARKAAWKAGHHPSARTTVDDELLAEELLAEDRLAEELLANDLRLLKEWREKQTREVLAEMVEISASEEFPHSAAFARAILAERGVPRDTTEAALRKEAEASPFPTTPADECVVPVYVPQFILVCDYGDDGLGNQYGIEPLLDAVPTDDELDDLPPSARCAVYDLQMCGSVGIYLTRPVSEDEDDFAWPSREDFTERDTP